MSSLPSPPSFIKRHTYQVNGFTFRTVLVEKGAFMMGDNKLKMVDCKPAHKVVLTSDFELAEYAVTQGLWLAVMGQKWQATRFKGAERPVQCLNWNDAKLFISELNKQYCKDGNYPDYTGYFSLPTEAQWEYAARGGPFSRFLNYPFSGSTCWEEVSWYEKNSHEETKPVSHKLPNILGLYDMSGNVWEWCEDDWRSNYAVTPRDGSANIENPRDSERVVRGGCYNMHAANCRVVHRESLSPNRSYGELGFRLAFIPKIGD
jgi:sulfatase modifying factor 1